MKTAEEIRARNREAQRRWRERNPNGARDAKRRSRERNPERAREVARIWRERNIEKVRELGRNWHHKNREKRNKAQSDYAKLHPEKSREYARRRRSSNMCFRIADRYRTKLKGLILGKYKDYTALKYFGCTRLKLMSHIESQFKPGMNWSNHSAKGWHVDHIVPVCAFDLTIPEQAAKCFHYTNTQPLWAEENIRKGKRLNNPNPK